MNSYSESVAGPRWVDIEGTLLAFGHLHDVRVTIDHVSRGLFRKRVWFTVTGQKSAILALCNDLIAMWSR